MGDRTDDGLKDSPEILIQNASSLILTSFSSVLRNKIDRAAKGVATRTLFNTVRLVQHPRSPALLLWVCQTPGPSSLSYEDAQVRCSKFLKNYRDNSDQACITLLRHNGIGRGDDKLGLQSILIVLSKVEDAMLCGALLSGAEEECFEDESLQARIAVHSNVLSSWTWLQPWWPRRHGYKTLSTTDESAMSWRRRLIICSSLITVAIIILVSTLLLMRGHTDDIYDRYKTTGSEGPKHQLRIYWQNASEWAAANPQDTDKWKVRIDDQAIIPAELYDEDEERYQQWYRNRYPEMQQVINNRDYIRPSWMGSLKMMVPWDNQFHFAHCVLALRRYWKAKESGKHVCGRDIDHLHIDHCLTSLEDRVFIEGPREMEDPPTYMYWQTKVCF